MILQKIGEKMRIIIFKYDDWHSDRDQGAPQGNPICEALKNLAHDKKPQERQIKFIRKSMKYIYTHAYIHTYMFIIST